MIMTDQQRKKAVSEYRKIKRLQIKWRIDELKKSNNELFKLWCYKKSIDDGFLRKSARNNLIEIEKLEVQYDKVASEEVTYEQIAYIGIGDKK